MNNFDSLEALTQGDAKNVEILGLCETHIINGDASDNGGLYDMSGYVFVKRRRTAGNGGGVAMYVKNHVNFKRIIDLENSHLESI